MSKRVQRLWLVAALLLAGWALLRVSAPQPLVAFAGVELFAAPDQLRLAPGGATLTMLQPDQPLRLRLVSRQPLASVTVDLSPEAPSQLAVAGGEVGLRLFRPDGTILYQLLLDPGRPIRRLWIGPKKFHYPLQLTLVGAPPGVGGAGAVQLTLTVEPVAPVPPPPANTEADHE